MDDTVWKTPRLVWRSCVTRRQNEGVSQKRPCQQLQQPIPCQTCQCVWPDTCNVLWYKVKEWQTGVTPRDMGTSPLREGVSLTRQPCQHFQSATCYHGMQIIWTSQTEISRPTLHWLSDSRSQTNPVLHHTPPNHYPVSSLSIYPLRISQLHLCHVLPIHPFLL